MLPACSQANPYVDMASLSALAKYTTGSVYYTPGFTPQTHAVKVQHEIVHNLTRTTGERIGGVLMTLLPLNNILTVTRVNRPVWHALACCSQVILHPIDPHTHLC